MSNNMEQKLGKADSDELKKIEGLANILKEYKLESIECAHIKLKASSLSFDVPNRKSESKEPTVNHQQEELDEILRLQKKLEQDPSAFIDFSDIR